MPKELSGSTPLAEARAWAGLPAAPPQDPRPALPCGSRRVIDSFVGHHRAKGFAEMPDHTSEERDERQNENRELRSLVGADTEAVIDAALVAGNFSDIGEAQGHYGKTAERQGKRILREAAKNLSAAIEKLAA